MSKPFFEVFPTLKAGEDICNMFEGAQVLKVTTNSDRTFLRVHIVSRHLIQKTLVYEMEHLIKNQLFGRSAVHVEIREKYELSGMDDVAIKRILKLFDKETGRIRNVKS